MSGSRTKAARRALRAYLDPNDPRTRKVLTPKELAITIKASVRWTRRNMRNVQAAIDTRTRVKVERDLVKGGKALVEKRKAAAKKVLAQVLVLGFALNVSSDPVKTQRGPVR